MAAAPAPTKKEKENKKKEIDLEKGEESPAMLKFFDQVCCCHLLCRTEFTR